MSFEMDLPASCRLRVLLYGPMEVWKRDDAGGWQLVEKEAWGKGRAARSVFKRLLVAPGRRLSRSTIQDDLWPHSEQFDLMDRTIYNAINQIRRVTGKTLLKTLETSYEVADQSVIWVDRDACNHLLKEVENQGYLSVQALPLLEQACEYLERGELLEGEDGTWVYGVRKKSEDLLRQVRLWLAENYERQGKLWQAGEQYRALLLLEPSNETALQQWLEMLVRHGKRQEALKCYRDMKHLIEEQGSMLSPEMEQVIEVLVKDSYRALNVEYKTEKIILPPLSEQPARDLLILTDNDISDRLATLLTQSSLIGATEIMYFNQQTRLYWRVREESTSSIVTLYPTLVKHIDSLTMALARSHSPAFRQQLCEIISCAVLLEGILLYDKGQYIKAQKTYQIAFQAAKEADNSILQAIIWGWTSFTWIYSQHYQKALYCIQYARHLAATVSDPFVQAWLAAIEAEIQSNLLNCDICTQWLNTFDQFIDVSPSADTAYLFEFNTALLLGYKGVCLQQFYRKQEPGTHVFLREAKEALELALSSEAPPKRKLYYLSDLASIYARQGDVEEACACVEQSLPTILQLGGGSKTIYKHLLQVRTLLQPYRNVAAIRSMDEQLHILYLNENEHVFPKDHELPSWDESGS